MLCQGCILITVVESEDNQCECITMCTGQASVEARVQSRGFHRVLPLSPLDGYFTNAVFAHAVCYRPDQQACYNHFGSWLGIHP